MGKQILEELGLIKEQIESLKSDCISKNNNEEWMQTKYDEMHRLMLRYQDGIVEKTVEPLLKSLIALSDGIRKDITFFETNESSRDMVEYLQGLLNQIDTILFEYDIEMYVGPDVFDPKLQRASRTIPVNEIEGDKHIESVVSVGYKRNDSIFRIEKVSIYKYIEGATDNE